MPSLSNRAVFGVLLSIVLTLSAAGCSAPPTNGSPPPAQITKTREALAKEAFEVGGLQQQITQSTRTALNQMAADTRFAAIVDEELAAAMGPLTESAAAVYAEAFTAQELSDIVAFFNTPSGKAYLAKQGQLVERIQPMSERFGQDLMRRIADRARMAGLGPR